MTQRTDEPLCSESFLLNNMALLKCEVAALATNVTSDSKRNFTVQKLWTTHLFTLSIHHETILSAKSLSTDLPTTLYTASFE